MLPLTNCAFNKNGDKYLLNISLDSSQVAMIELVKYGTLLQEKKQYLWKDIRMQYIVQHLTIPLGNKIKVYLIVIEW